MSVATPQGTWTDVELADAVRDHLRLEMIAVGHVAPRGEVHVTDHTILAHTGGSSVFNRGTALDLEQPDVTFTEVERFFDGLPHTLWLEAHHIDEGADDLLRGRGYVPLPDQSGVALTSFSDDLAHAEPSQHADLITDPSEAAGIADVVCSGFGLGVDDRLLFEDVARAVLRHARPWTHGAIYGIRREQVAVSVGALLCTADAAGIAGLATATMHRHHGHGSSITARALHDAAAQGYRAAVAIATPDSTKVFERLGFEAVLRYRVYRQTRP